MCLFEGSNDIDRLQLVKEEQATFGKSLVALSSLPSTLLHALNIATAIYKNFIPFHI